MDATPDEILAGRCGVERVAGASGPGLIERKHARRGSEVTPVRCLGILPDGEPAGELTVLCLEVEARRDDRLVYADRRLRGLAPDHQRYRRERRETRVAARARQDSLSREA